MVVIVTKSEVKGIEDLILVEYRVRTMNAPDRTLNNISI